MLLFLRTRFVEKGEANAKLQDYKQRIEEFELGQEMTNGL
jgi:hypothetical protein